MKTTGKLPKWWQGLKTRCQNCTEGIIFEGLEGELLVHEGGDMKEEAILYWLCPSCGSKNYTSYSRLKEVKHRPWVVTG